MAQVPSAIREGFSGVTGMLAASIGVVCDIRNSFVYKVTLIRFG
jgi:hypothetical protein